MTKFTDEELERVQECIKSLLLTSRGELIGDPDYGTNLYSVNEKNKSSNNIDESYQVHMKE